MKRLVQGLISGAGALTVMTTALAAQATGEFDLDRALIMDQVPFEPFRVTDTRSLRAALDNGDIDKETRLLVMEHSTGSLALVVDQMAYHHVAQGDINGEAWMVSF